ncbi:MAG: L-threonylcarbamoyladenylate synthase [Eubacteriales bacterium]
MIVSKTQILRISPNPTAEDEEKLAFAADIIRRGGLVVFPTETVYGLGANALDENAARSIYAAKGRPQNNPLIIHLADKNDIDTYCKTAGVAGIEPLKALMPAPLTVILPAKPVIPSVITAGLPNVAVRVPRFAAARRLIELAGVPIAAPSANLSGKPSPTCARHVIEDMDGRADVILDGGDCEVGVESTIITLCEECPTLLRPGGVTYETLCSLLGEVHLSRAVLESLKPGDTVLSPGMMYKHYAPDRPVELIKGEREQGIRYVNARAAEKPCAVLCFDEDAPRLHCKAVLSAGSEADSAAYAARLFSLLRDTNALDIEYVYAFLPKDTDGISLAVYNRLLRAAGFRVTSF